MNKPSDKLIQMILNDRLFSLEIAKRAGIREISIIRNAERRSPKLVSYTLVRFYKSKGLTENEIFEKEEIEAK